MNVDIRSTVRISGELRKMESYEKVESYGKKVESYGLPRPLFVTLLLFSNFLKESYVKC